MMLHPHGSVLCITDRLRREHWNREGVWYKHCRDWCHHGVFSMMTSSNGNIFRVTGPLCGEFTGEFPSQRPVTRSFDVFFDLCLNKWLSKQSWGRWFETHSRSSSPYSNGYDNQLTVPPMTTKIGIMASLGKSILNESVCGFGIVSNSFSLLCIYVNSVYINMHMGTCSMLLVLC